MIESENIDDPFKVRNDGTPADPIELTDPNMIDISRVINGGSFGALALTDGKPRITTTKCLIRTHLLVLSRDDWCKCKQDIERRKTHERVQFVKTIPIFGKLSTTYLNQRLMPNFQDIRVSRGQYITKEGQPADKIYIIKDGEFQVTKSTAKKQIKKVVDVREILEDP